MIPLRDKIPSSTFPFITILLIIVNVLLFLFEISLGPQINKFINIFGMIPQRYFYLTEHNWINVVGRFYPFITSIFLHGGWMHLIGNMWFLWIFGDNVEDRLGHLNFLVIYTLFGVIAGLVHAYINPNSLIPTVGASGAVSGVMGAYIVFYPRSRILTLLPIFIFIYFVEISAFFFLGLWFLFQFLSGTAALMSQSNTIGGVAWWAHIGGFFMGIVIALIFYRKGKNKRHNNYQ